MWKSCLRSLKSLSEFIRFFLLISLRSELLKIWYCKFAHRSSHFFLLSAITPKIKVCSRAMSDWAISKSDVPKWLQKVKFVKKNRHKNQQNNLGGRKIEKIREAILVIAKMNKLVLNFESPICNSFVRKGEWYN